MGLHLWERGEGGEVGHPPPARTQRCEGDLAETLPAGLNNIGMAPIDHNAPQNRPERLKRIRYEPSYKWTRALVSRRRSTAGLVRRGGSREKCFTGGSGQIIEGRMGSGDCRRRQGGRRETDSLDARRSSQTSRCFFPEPLFRALRHPLYIKHLRLNAGPLLSSLLPSPSGLVPLDA